jgi:hypothetical protein
MRSPVTSERKIAANRSNSRRSSGPRSEAGKDRVSRNAVRHGLAALLHRQTVPSAEMEQLTDAICAGEQDPLLREQAATIAETMLVLQAVQTQKGALVERLKERGTIAITSGDNTLIRAKARIFQRDLAQEQLDELSARVLEQYKDRLPAIILDDDLMDENGCFGGLSIPLQILALDEYAKAEESMEEAYETRFDRLEQAGKLLKERNESQALLEALPDLVRLDRYERRAWARQKRAIRNFMRIKSSLANHGSANLATADTATEIKNGHGDGSSAGV